MAGSSETPPDVILYENTVDTLFEAVRISDVCDYIFDSGYFYNSQYHLNAEGRTVRSGMLADNILSYLESNAES